MHFFTYIKPKKKGWKQEAIVLYSHVIFLTTACLALSPSIFSCPAGRIFSRTDGPLLNITSSRGRDVWMSVHTRVMNEFIIKLYCEESRPTFKTVSSYVIHQCGPVLYKRIIREMNNRILVLVQSQKCFLQTECRVVRP